MNRIERIDVADYRITDRPLTGQTVTGYGNKVPTCYQIKLKRTRKNWRRVYCRIFGNSGTCYVRVGGAEHILNFETF